MFHQVTRRALLATVVGTGVVATLGGCMKEAEFPDYAIAVWDVPAVYGPDRSRIETNAKEFVLAKSTAGDFHVILFFDLRPDAKIELKVREP